MTNVAMIYDVDKTLIRGYHPSLILERRGIDIKKFWGKVAVSQKIEEDNGEKTRLDIIYLAQFMNEVRNGDLNGLSIKEIEECGKDLDKMCYKGIPEFFTRVKKENPNKNISHNLVSVGIKPLLEASILGQHVDNTFGYTFYDHFTPGPQIDEVRSTTSSIEKIAAIVDISKGNQPDIYEYLLKNAFYFGDGQTDKPAFKFIKRYHGTAVGVFDPEDPNSYKKAKETIGRNVHYLLPADFTESSELCQMINEVIQGLEENIVKKKTWPDLFERVKNGEKTAELRLADFEINEGDILLLQEWNPKTEQYTGRELRKRVKNINKVNLTDFHTPEEILSNDYLIIDLA